MPTADIWAARATLCELVALSFRYPDEVLAEALASGEWLEAAYELARVLDLQLPDNFGCGLKVAADDSVADADSDSGADSDSAANPTTMLRALRPEATRLFVGSPEPVTSPYEGVWRAKADGVQALLFVNPHSMEVERFCKSCGLGRPEGTNEPLDHVATEFELLQYLAAVAAGIAEPAEDGVAAADLPGGSAEAAYETFMTEHVKVWMPDFTQAVIDESRQPLYASAAQLVRAFVL